MQFDMTIVEKISQEVRKMRGCKLRVGVLLRKWAGFLGGCCRLVTKIKEL
jgi:hypothetical protein